MKSAWATYRQADGNLRQFFADGFRYCLKAVWVDAKKRARVLSIPAKVRQEKIAELREEIERLTYKPARVDITEHRRHLQDEIHRLSATA